jgi:hypothetical protein
MDSVTTVLAQVAVPNDPHFLPMGAQTWRICVLVAIVGCAVVGVMVLFGWRLFRSNENFWWSHYFNHEIVLGSLKDAEGRSSLLRYSAALYADFAQRRNEFWAAYLQVLVAALLIILLTILLITKTISAEAGLPILSAVSGFAIAKGASTPRTNPTPEQPRTTTEGRGEAAG